MCTELIVEHTNGEIITASEENRMGNCFCRT